ncbi:MAG: hypothetical protein KDC83_02920 [Flavobacteriales bacterium]|nr:hypothetical protein [Flavobacteriales bacterium]
MKKIIGWCIILCLFIGINDGVAQNKKDKKKSPIAKRLWGGYDSNAIEKNLEIKDAFVTEGEEMLEGVYVNVYINNNKIDSAITDKSGGFSFNLKFDYKYQIKFSKNGFVTKFIEIDLQNMPPQAKKEGYDLGRFQLGMLRKVENMDTGEFSVPVARYYYDEVSTLIQLDRVFLKSRKAAIAKQKEQNAALLAQQNQIDVEKDAEYNRLIRDADIELAAKDYELAKSYYKEAIKLKTLEEYPRAQLTKIDGLEKDELGESEKYRDLIKQGDEAFDAEDYESAKIAYTSAMKINSLEAYPRERIKKIELLEKEQKIKKPEVKEKTEYSLSAVQISADKSAFCAELARKYPQGLTEEIYQDGSKTVTRRIIVDGQIGVEYKKIVHNWGGVYYFKNGSPATNFVWQKEAIQ